MSRAALLSGSTLSTRPDVRPDARPLRRWRCPSVRELPWPTPEQARELRRVEAGDGLYRPGQAEVGAMLSLHRLGAVFSSTGCADFARALGFGGVLLTRVGRALLAALDGEGEA